MKLLFKAECGPHITYRVDGKLYEVGDTFVVDPERGAAILASHPNGFEDVTGDGEGLNVEVDVEVDAPVLKAKAKTAKGKALK